VIFHRAVALFDLPFKALFRRLIVVCFLTFAATAKSSQRPRVYVDASLVKDLVSTPVPNYPLDALHKKWGGFWGF